jgi:hypothetical protein
VFSVDRSVHFTAMNGDLFRGFDAQAHLITADFHNRDHNVLIDDDAFIFLARQNQHSTQLSKGVAGVRVAKPLAASRRAPSGAPLDQRPLEQSDPANCLQSGTPIVQGARKHRQAGDRNKSLVPQ